jgi:hypothetical protein
MDRVLSEGVGLLGGIASKAVGFVPVECFSSGESHCCILELMGISTERRSAANIDVLQASKF